MELFLHRTKQGSECYFLECVCEFQLALSVWEVWMTLRALFSPQHLLEIRLRFSQISPDGRRGWEPPPTTAHWSDESFLSTQNLLQESDFS